MTAAVAIALYNGERFIEKQLDSIRLQTYKPDKVVLCDDGSKDNTVQIVREYIAKYALCDRWTLLENETNLGYIRNFYKAISLCDTDVVFLSDQDDIWKEQKIEKMMRVMGEKDEIVLLSCKYGIINADDERQHSLVEPSAKQDEKISAINTETILRAYRWPGMLMCVRKEFFDGVLPMISESRVAHDFMLACLAADIGGFYEYNYVGAFHRRHDNNVAREEHRLFKLLNLNRKLTDIGVTEKLWETFLNENIDVSQETGNIVEKHLMLLKERKIALENKSLWKIIKLYARDKGKQLRLKSFICDVWLTVFGRK